VLRAVRARLPHEDLVYLADQAHVPYGDRPVSELRRLLADNVAFLERAGVDAVVMGCNTSCSIAARHGWPASRVPIFDLIEAAAGAVAASAARRVGVIATTATARSGAYGDAIRARVPQAAVEEVAAPALVPLVEAGILTGPIARAAVAAACARFTPELDALVLGCTHYPLLDGAFAGVLGAGVLRIDPALAQSERAFAFVAARDAGHGLEGGRTRYVTTGPLEPFREALRALVGPPGPGDEIVGSALARVLGASNA
jgi:glutamate racemase